MNVTRLLLAVIAGTAIANNYAIQPALATVAADLGVGLPVIGLAPTAALVGCMAGFVLLLPLTDRVAPHRLVAAQLAVLATALAVAAASGDAVVFLAAYLVIGAAAGVAAQAGVIAGRHAPPGGRATAVATVAAGLSAGILLSRLIGGALTDLLGWRSMLLVFAAVAVLGAVAAGLLLPGSSPRREPAASSSPDPRYLAALADLPRQLRRYRTLRWAVASGGLWYLAFHLVWVALALALAPQGPTVVGLYSLAGLLGFIALPYAGRLTDRLGPATAIAASLVIAAAGTALLVTGLDHPPVTALGLALLDAGLFVAQAANQSRIQALDPRSSGSLSSVYMVLYFAVGAVGAALAGPLLDTIGWRGATLVALAALLAALGTDQAAVRRQRPHRLEGDEPAPLQT